MLLEGDAQRLQSVQSLSRGVLGGAERVNQARPKLIVRYRRGDDRHRSDPP